MNKTLLAVLGVIVLVGVCVFFCPFRKGMMCMTKGMMESKAKPSCMKGDLGPMGKMSRLEMHGDTKKEVLLTSDGGVIVVTGNKIIKFDRDLKKIKEVEIIEKKEHFTPPPLAENK
jgi:hypothetical protein